MKSRTTHIWISASLALGLLVAGVWLLVRPTTLTPESQLAQQTQAQALGVTPERFSPGPGGEEEEGGEGQVLLSVADYFVTRYTYPTGEFDATWLAASAEQAKLVPTGIPAGTYELQRNVNGTQAVLDLDPLQFTSLGPQPLQSNGCQGCFPYGLVSGRIEVIVTDPISTNIAYFGSDGGGVWKTTNCCSAATTWTHVTDDENLYGLAVDDLVIDPNNHNILYGGTGDLNFGSFSFGTVGVLKSTDYGETWELLGTDVFTPGYPRPTSFPQYQAIGKVRVDPRNSNTVIAGTKTGLFFSYDAGVNWTGPCLTNNFSAQRQDITGLIVHDNGTNTLLYAAVGTRGFNTTVQPDLNLNGANAVYSTTVPSNGCPASWNLLNTGWPAGTGGGTPYPTNTIGRVEIAMAPSNPNVIYAQVADIPNAGGHLGVWRTDNGGATWVQASGPSGPGGCDGPGNQSWYNQILAVDPNNSSTVWMGTIDQFRSTNAGATFSNASCGYSGGTDLHVDQHALAYVGGTSNQLLIGSDGGIYYSPNANAADINSVTFTQLNNTVSTIEFYSGDITNNFAYDTDPGINAGAQDNGSSVFVWNNIPPGPAIWQVKRGGDGMYARIEQLQGLRWYQESQNGNIYVSTTGPNGTYVSAENNWGGDRLSFVFPYEMDKFDCSGGSVCGHMIAGTYRVWETISGAIPATSWYINSPDLTKNTLGNRSFINQLSYAPTDNSIAMVGTNDGNVQFGFGLGQGGANTASWVNVTDNNTILPNRPVLDVTVHHITPTIGFAAVGGFDNNTPSTPGHVFQVTCNADCSSFTWENKTGNLPNIPADSIITNPNIPEQVFVGTDWGLYYTNDIRQDPPVWEHFTAGLPAIMIWDMAVDREGTTLAVFTRSRGAYVWPLPVGYDVTASTSVETGEPGTTVVHHFTVTNEGQDDAYTFSVNNDEWAATIVSGQPISLTAGVSTVVSVEVQIPVTATYNQLDEFDFVVQSVVDPDVSVSAIGRTIADGTAAVQISGDQTGEAEEGEVVTYTVHITNTGTVTDSFDITVGSSVWSVSTSTGSVGPLGVGETAVFEVYVTVGTGTADSVEVTVTSQFHNTVSNSVTLTTTAIIPPPTGFTIYLPTVQRP